jgi:hypothetical protein
MEGTGKPLAGMYTACVAVHNHAVHHGNVSPWHRLQRCFSWLYMAVHRSDERNILICPVMQQCIVARGFGRNLRDRFTLGGTVQPLGQSTMTPYMTALYSPSGSLPRCCAWAVHCSEVRDRVIWLTGCTLMGCTACRANCIVGVHHSSLQRLGQWCGRHDCVILLHGLWEWKHAL